MAADQAADPQTQTLLYGILGSAVTSLFALITLIVKGIRDDRRVERQRRWDVEDRRERSEVQLHHVESLHKAIAANDDKFTAAIDAGQRAFVEVDHISKHLDAFTQRIAAAKERDQGRAPRDGV